MPHHTQRTTESNTDRISRRSVLATGAGALATGLAGCAGLTGGSGGDGGSEASSDDVEINYWMYFGAQESEEMTALVDEFNSQDNGIYVNTQSVPFGEFLNKLFTSVNAGEAPHVASYYGSFGRHLEPITDPIDDYLSEGAANEYFDIAWENMQVDGRPYALPIDVHGKGLYTNDSVLDSAGVDPDFTDWDGFSNACDTIVSETDSRAFSFLNWDSPQAAFRTYSMALTQAGGEFLTGEPGNYEVTFDDEIGLETGQLMADITGDFGWDVPQFQSESARVEDFIGGDLGMIIAGTWSINNFENEDGEIPENLDFSFEKPFMFPGDGEEVAWAESNSLYFPTNESHTETEKQAAVEFAEYVTQNNTLWASAGAHLPAAESVATSDEVQSTPLWEDYGTISTMYEMVNEGQVRYQPQTPINLNSNQYWSPLMDLYQHNTDPERAIEKSASALQSALDSN